MMNKSPLSSYYGGKARLRRHIIPIIAGESFARYCEPFAGGASVFFGLDLRRKDVWLNDIDGRIINFYRVAKSQPKDLVRYARARGLNAKEFYKEAKDAWEANLNPKTAQNIHGAWAVWYLSAVCFAGDFNGGFGFSKVYNRANRIYWKLDALEKTIKQCGKASYDNRCAIDFINKNDTGDTMFYCDPPYIGTKMGHYSGFSEDDYIALLKCLAALPNNQCSKFVLSSYPNDILSEFIKSEKWTTTEIKTDKTGGAGIRKPATELLVMNFARNTLL